MLNLFCNHLFSTLRILVIQNSYHLLINIFFLDRSHLQFLDSIKLKDCIVYKKNQGNDYLEFPIVLVTSLKHPVVGVK